MKNIKNTYCNPLPLPDYPLGRKCVTEDIPSFRETADPTVIYEEGKWYLYSSCGMAYYSEDFITWKHVHTEPYDMGYAPTVVKFRGRFFMTASSDELRVSENPLGPFLKIGSFTGLDGKNYHNDDPMLFADGDRLYLYWGCGGAGIYGVELDPDKPNLFISEPKLLFSYNPSHLWERVGDWNEDSAESWIEGSFMYKHNGTYYLTYAGPGTEWTTYAMGAYKSDSPLGDFVYMKSSPFLRKTEGMVRGPGHGCIVDGPNGTIWAFYTCLVCYSHPYERRIGVDAVEFDEHGDFKFINATEIPQFAPGSVEKPFNNNGAGILPLTFHRRSWASSAAPGRDPLYAFDDNMLTWWQPEEGDNNPELYVMLPPFGAALNSVRIIWREVGLDIRKGINPGAFQYKIEALKNSSWSPVLDRSDSKDDYIVDYQTFDEVEANIVKFIICGWPEGVKPGLISLTMFGKALPEQ